MRLSLAIATPRRRLFGLLVLALLVVAVIAAPERVRRYAEQILAEASGGSAQIAAIHITPWRLAPRLDGMRLTVPAAPTVPHG